MRNSSLLATAALVAAIGLAACGGSDSPTPTPSAGGSGSVAPGPVASQPAPPARKDVELVYDVPTMVCRIECPKRIDLAANRYPWVRSVRVDPVKRRLTLRCVDPDNADLLMFERELRQMGYLVQLLNRDKLPPSLARQVLTPPTEGAYGIEISHWRKMAGCSTRGVGPNPEQVIVALRAVIEAGYFEVDLSLDKIRIVPADGKPTPDEVIEAIQTTGAKARREGDTTSLPATIRAALAKSEGKRILVSFHAQGCAICTRMKKTTLADEKVKAALEGLSVIDVDTVEDEATARYYNVTATPALVLLDPQGLTVRTLAGFKSVDEVLAGLE